MVYRSTFRDADFADDIIQELLGKLRDGESMRAICKDPRMPSRDTVDNWAKGDGELAADILRARETGYYARAEQAVADAKEAKDAGLGRLAFDAERWHLSKLASAFADKVVHAGSRDEPIRYAISTDDLTDDQLRALASIPIQHSGR